MQIFSDLDFRVFSPMMNDTFLCWVFDFPRGKIDFDLVSFDAVYDFREFVYRYYNIKGVIFVGGDGEVCITSYERPCECALFPSIFLVS